MHLFIPVCTCLEVFCPLRLLSNTVITYFDVQIVLALLVETSLFLCA